MKSLSRDLPAWGISLIINLCILIPLHFIVRESNREPDVAIVDSLMEDVPEEDFQFVVADDVVGTEGDTSMTAPASEAAMHVGNEQTTPQERLQEVMVPELAPIQSPIDIPHDSPIASLVESAGPTTEDFTEGGVEGTMDYFTYAIAQSLRERQTLVIWMFDASLSLNDRRAAIADRFENVYKQLENMGAREGLHTAVCSYGQKTSLMTPEAVTDVSDMVEAVRNIEPDDSGQENVFAALNLAIEKWKTFRRHEGRWNKMVVIVTDERGDDAEAGLEDVINKAKRFQFRCYVAGNAAVFGQKEGMYPYRYEDGFVMDIPVDQGPETAFPHILQLPFWGSGQLRMSAAFGPYALTRLTGETGGVYLVTDDNGQQKFDMAVMREYAPDYRPVRVLEAEIKAHPAKLALVNTARQTYVDSFPLPTLLFSAESDNQLRQEITAAQRPVAEAEYWVDRMYDQLKQGERARDSLKEARWRASWDLAMGRLLAMKVRLKGYNLMLAQMKSNPKPFEKNGSNEWRLVPSAEIDTGPQIRKAGEEARELLKAVIDDHPGTPWERLAIKELGQDVGWSWQEGMHYVPGMENRTDLDQEQVRLLLAEEMRRQQRSTQAAKQRPVPKL